MRNALSLEKEDFYVKPPFHYKPSLVQYLTDLNANERAFFADLLYLDRKGNINIEAYEKDKLIIRLKNDKNLSSSERFIWNFLNRFREKNSDTVILGRSNVNRMVIEFYSFLVQRDYFEYFYINRAKHSGPSFWFGLFAFSIMKLFPTKSEFSLLLINFLYAIFGLLAWLFSGLLLFIFVPYSFFKIAKYPSELKTLVRKFVLDYIKLYALFFMALLSILFLAAWLPLGNMLTSYMNAYSDPNASLIFAVGLFTLMFFMISIMLIMFSIYFYYFGRFFTSFITWLFENSETQKHREQWLRFKKFICSYSALEKRPLKYYELWGELYYYALAIGAVKEISFS